MYQRARKIVIIAELRLRNSTKTRAKEFQNHVCRFSAKKFFESFGLHNLRKQGFTVDVMHDPNKWLQENEAKLEAEKQKKAEAGAKAKAEAAEAKKKRQHKSGCKYG